MFKVFFDRTKDWDDLEAMLEVDQLDLDVKGMRVEEGAHGRVIPIGTGLTHRDRSPPRRVTVT